LSAAASLRTPTETSAVGGTASPNFPIKNGTPVNTQKPSDPTCSENMDAYVTKFSSTGELLWSTALGASNYDRAYDVVKNIRKAGAQRTSRTGADSAFARPRFDSDLRTM
jgi:hypothetical protein